MKYYIMGAVTISSLLLSGCNEGSQMASHVTQTTNEAAQKDVYYEKYAQMIESVNEKGTSAHLTLIPLDSFEAQDWVELVAFEKRVQERYEETLRVHVKEVEEHPANVSKTATLTIGERQEAVMINAMFQTTVAEDEDRVRFKMFDGIAFHAMQAQGTWQTDVYKAVLADDRTSYTVTLQARYTEGGIETTHDVTLTFYCTEVGTVH